MTERDLLIKEKVENRGIFDFKGLYRFAHNWFKDEGYGVDEDEYVEKVSGNSRDIDIKWKATKKLSDYFKVEHLIKFKIEKLTDVEVEIDGEKKQTNKGKVEVEIKSSLVSDPESKWDKSPTQRFLRDVYSKYIIPTRVDNVKNEVIGDAQKFKEELKSCLELMGKR